MARRPLSARVATLAAPYVPRRPTETVLHAVVREEIETFLRWARESYAKPLPRYVENELRGYLRCGVFAHGFVRARCDGCGHELLVAFSCKGRGVCPSCAGRRMANTAAHLVDRVLPVAPVRQWVLSLPWELRRLAAFDARALAIVVRAFAAAVLARYRRGGPGGAEGGAVTFVQRFGGSLNLNVHLHVVAVDGVFTREGGEARFHEAVAPARAELEAVARAAAERILRALRRRGLLRDGADPGDNDGDGAPSAPAALDACAAAAIRAGPFVELRGEGNEEAGEEIPEGAPRAAASADCRGFDLHAGVRIAAEDDAGRERLCRYGARPAFALGRLRRLRDGRVAYRVRRPRAGKAKHLVLTPLELLARLAALVPPPRHPLVRYHGALAPSSPWRRLVVPRPPEPRPPCPRAAAAPAGAGPPAGERAQHRSEPRPPGGHAASSRAGALAPTPRAPPSDGKLPAVWLAPNVLSIPHWERLDGGALLAASPRLDWATLLRRTFAADVLACPQCAGRLRVLGAVTEPAAVRAALARLDIPPPPRLAKARDPTDHDAVDPEPECAD